MATDFSSITEVPGGYATPEGLRMLYTRYHLAGTMAADADVLEVAAGAGVGLGHLARKARSVAAVDVTPALAASAHDLRVPSAHVAVASADRLPFEDARFDLVVLYEAIYYLPDVAAFFAEARRVLRPGGRLLVCSANRRRLGFVRSPHSRAYYDARELADLYRRHGFADVEVMGAFPADPPSWRGRVLLQGFGWADRMRLIPRSLRGRARFKRLLFGRMEVIPPMMEPGAMDPEPIVPWRAEDDSRWKVIYAVGRRAPS